MCGRASRGWERGCPAAEVAICELRWDGALDGFDELGIDLAEELGQGDEVAHGADGFRLGCGFGEMADEVVTGADGSAQSG